MVIAVRYQQWEPARVNVHAFPNPVMNGTTVNEFKKSAAAISLLELYSIEGRLNY